MQPMPTPTPYRNLSRDMEIEDKNAEHLMGGVEDAKARLKIAAEQFKANPSKPVEDIYNKAAQDLLDRTNRMEKARTRAREIELQIKQENAEPAAESKATRDPASILSLLSAVPEEAEAAKKVVQPKPYNLETILAMAGKKAAPRVATPTPAPTPTPEATPTPNPLNPALQNAARNAAAGVRQIRAGGVGAIGEKAEVTGKDTDEVTATKNLALDREYMDAFGDVIRSTPEWKGQAQGLDAMEALIRFQAERNADQTKVDLSPLGAYLDYQSALRGKPTNLAASLKGQAIDDTAMKDMGEVQRRRGDMSKALIDAIRASKVGQVVTKDGVIIGTTSGFEAPRPLSGTGQAGLDQRDWKAALAEKHKMFDKSDIAMNSLNTIVREMGEQIPSDLNRMQIQKAMVDMNGMRPALAEVMMEGGNQTIMNRFLSLWDKNIAKGTKVTDRDLDEFWHSARAAFKAMQSDRLSRGKQLKDNLSGFNIDSTKFNKIASPEYISYSHTANLKDMPENVPTGTYKYKPAGSKAKESKKSLSPEEIKQIMEAMKGPK